jgi:transposase
MVYVLKPSKKVTVLTLLERGESEREIQRKTGVDRKTVRKYGREHGLRGRDSNSPTVEGVAAGSAVDGVQIPPPRPPALAALSGAKIPKLARSACEVHREFIEREVDKDRNAQAIYQDLVEQFAFTHRYNSVKRFVRGLRRREPARFDRLDFGPGEEAQVDYGEGAPTRNPKTSRYRKPRLFVMTLRYSRRSFRKVVWKSSSQVWARLHEEAFRYFGGAVEYVVLDNLKEGIITPDIYEPELNAVFAAMLVHYGVVADPARVRDPDRKGTVENAIQHTQGTALKGKQFESIEDQNEWLMHWEEKWAALRIHGRTKRQVEAMFQEEKPHLKPLPLLSFRYFEQETRTVQDDGCIQVGNSYYTARPAPLHTQVVVRIFEAEIEIFDLAVTYLIRRHPRSLRPGHLTMPEEDRIYNPSRQTRQILDQANSIGPSAGKLCQLFFEGQGRAGHRKMRGVVSLTRHFDAALIEKACSVALDKKITSSRAVKEIVARFALCQNEQRPPEALVQTHPLIREPEQYEMFWRQHTTQHSLFEEGAQPGPQGLVPETKPCP